VVALLLVAVSRGEQFTGSERGLDPLSERVGNWQVAAAQITDHPLAGVGWGGYGAAYTLHQRPGMNQSHYAHNSYMQLAAEGGLWTLPFALVLLGWVAWGLARREDGPESWGIHLALVATLVHNLVDFSLYMPGVAVPFFALLGSAAARSRSRQPAPRAGRASAGVLAFAIPLLAVPSALAWDAARGAREALLAGAVGQSGDRMERAVALDPWTAEYRDFLARWELEHGEGDPASRERARGHATSACRLARLTPHHRTTLQMTCLAEGDIGCAYRAAVRGAALFPASPEYAGRLAEMRRALGVR
jgi:hypothetical protein